MNTNVYFFCILVVMIDVCWCSDPDYIPKDWVDPNDMRNYDRQSKTMKQRNLPVNENQNHAKPQMLSCNNDSGALKSEISRYEIFIERFINHFLHVNNFRNSNVKENLTSNLFITISPEELETLIKLGQKFSSNHLTELDKLFVHLFLDREKKSFEFPSIELSMIDFILEYKEKLVMSIVIITFGFTLWMFKSGKSIFRILAFLYLMFFLFGLVWNWWYMYQEAIINQFIEIKKNSDHIPEDCTPNKMTWFVYFRSFFKTSSDCSKYYKAHNIDPFSVVIPSIIFAETFSTMLTHPLNNMGKALGDFCFGISSNIPWPLNLIFYPFVLIIIILALILVIALYFNASIKLWSLVGGLHIGNSNSQSCTTRQNCSHIIENANDLLHLNDIDSKYILVRKDIVQQKINTDFNINQEDTQAFTPLSLNDANTKALSFGNEESVQSWMNQMNILKKRFVPLSRKTVKKRTRVNK